MLSHCFFFFKDVVLPKKQSNVFDKFKMVLQHSAYQQPPFSLKGWDNQERDQWNTREIVRELDLMHLSLSLVCSVHRESRTWNTFLADTLLSEVRHFPSRTYRVQWITLCNLRTYSRVRLCYFWFKGLLKNCFGYKSQYAWNTTIQDCSADSQNTWVGE